MPDTIAALASARGQAGVAVIRLSGPDAVAAAAALAGPLPEPRRAALRTVRADGAVLDQALVLVFPGPGSFTGEDVVELHTHGSPAVVAAVLLALTRRPDVRLAEAGEFTRRALMAGRMDVAQVEGLGDLIAAETEAQRIAAQRLVSGALKTRADAWRDDLLAAAALLEAAIDFSDEEIPGALRAQGGARLASLGRALTREAAGVAVQERIRDGFEVAIVGRPNAGKSTLLNAIAGRPAALTSEVAGTTRDVIEVRLDLGGLPVTLLDTAGLRAADDPVERQGVALARSRAEAADLRVWLDDGTGPAEIGLSGADIVVAAKDDAGRWGGVSGVTGAGVGPLLDRIGTVLSARIVPGTVATRDRHRAAIETAAAAVGAASAALQDGAAEEVVAVHIRAAAAALDALVGRVGVEDMLGEIFSRFCIGK